MQRWVRFERGMPSPHSCGEGSWMIGNEHAPRHLEGDAGRMVRHVATG